MADPFSLAASAAGLVSLGLEVCKGIVQYYGAWKNSKLEAKRMINSVDSLSTTLTQLYDVLSKKHVVFPKDGTDHLEANIELCRESISELDSELSKCKRLLPPKSGEKSTFTQAVREQSSRLSYPFRESTMLKIQEAVDDLRSNLHSAMLALQLATAPVIDDRLNTVISMLSLESEIGKGINELLADHRDEKIEAILDWLSKLKHRVKHDENLKRYQQGTGQYFLQSNQFLDWLAYQSQGSTSCKRLWCHGAPGTGKSVLAAAVIDILERQFKTHRVGVVFVYYVYAERTEQTLETVLGSLVRQLLRQRGSIPEFIRSKYEQSESPPDSEWLSMVWRDLVADFDRIFIVLDALDESNEQDDILSLVPVLTAVENKANIFLTSRPKSEIKELLADGSSFEVKAQSDDIKLLLNSELDKRSHLNRLCSKTEGLREEVVRRITARSDGMFLLARFHMDVVAKKLNLISLRKSLDILPVGLDSMYDDTMRRIQDQDDERRQLAMRTIMLLNFSRDRLAVHEMQHALVALELVATNDDIDINDLYPVELLLDVCAGLVVLVEEMYGHRNLVFVHHSAEEYFQLRRDDMFPGAHEQLAGACLAYLQVSWASDVDIVYSLPSTTDVDKRQAHTIDQFWTFWAFSSYAIDNWSEHTLEGDAEALLFDEICGFLNIIFNDEESTSGLMPSDALLPDQMRSTSCPVVLSSGLRLGKLLAHYTFIGLPTNNYTWESGFTALHWTVWHGDVLATGFLLSAGADPNGVDRKGDSPLSLAMRNFDEHLVKQLIKAGADVNISDPTQPTPLMQAVMHPIDTDDEIFLAIIEGPPKGTAAYRDIAISVHVDRSNVASRIVWMLLEAGANPNTSIRGFPALHMATCLARADVISSLVSAGAEVNAVDESARTSSQAAACLIQHEVTGTSEIWQFGLHAASTS